MKTKHFVVAGVAIALIAGCKKETHSGATPVNVNNPVRDWCEANMEAAIQSFTVNATTGGTITGADGVQISFVPGAFLTAGGLPVTGIVAIELVEALGVPEMILFNKQALGYDGADLKPLVSGGQINLTISQGGQPLKLVDNGTLVDSPAAAPDPAKAAFYGSEDGTGNVTWDPAPSDVLMLPDSSALFQFFNDSTGWINCDYFYDPVGTNTAVTITAPSGYDQSNTMVFLVFSSINSIASLPNFTGGSFTTSPYYQLPVGMNISIVALSVIGGSYSSSITTATVAVGMNVPLTFTPTTPAQFELDVQGL